MRDRERPVRRRRPLGLLLVLVLLGALLLYFRCGDGLGLGLGLWPGEGGDDRASDPDRSTPEASEVSDPAAGELRPAVGGEIPPARRCQLRLDGAGLSVDGESTDTLGAVARCRSAGAADLVVTGDAVYGQLESLRAALEGAGVPVFVRDTTRAGASDAGAVGGQDKDGASGAAGDGAGAGAGGGAATGGGAGPADDSDG